MINIAELRKEYSLKTLTESEVLSNPMEQFELWLNEAIKVESAEPNAMALATCTFDGMPSVRFVLLKSIAEGGLVFFTNYESNKAKQILKNPNAATVFYWTELERQVRFEGVISKITTKQSDDYFESRPEKSKLGAWASPQSQVIPSRKYLENLMLDFMEEFSDKAVVRPDNWGGYILKPVSIEFWQGRENRMHDRILYTEENGKWKIQRLAP